MTWLLEELEAEKEWEQIFAESEDVLDRLANEAIEAPKKNKKKPLDINPLRSPQRQVAPADPVREMGDMEPEPFAECEHPCVIREHDSVDLLQALLVSDAYDHIHELIPKAFTLKVVMDHNSKLPLPEIGFNDQPPDPDEPLSLPLPEFGDDCHLPIIINIAEADQHLMGDLLDDLEESPPQRLLGQACGHLLFQRFVFGSHRPQEDFGSVG